MKYSVVIPTYNHCDDLLKPCIETLLKHTNMSNVELIVSANGCTDNTREYLESLSASFNTIGMSNHFKAVWSDTPLGYSGACNAGVQAAVGEFIILLNNDVVFLEQEKNTWLDLLNQEFANNSKCGISCVVKMFSECANREFAIFFLVMIHRAVFDKIGLLNTDYGDGAGEDMEFCIEAEKAGFEVCQVGNKEWSEQAGLWVTQIPVYHRGEGTVHDKQLFPNWDSTFLKNSFKVAKKFNDIWAEPKIKNDKKIAVITPIHNDIHRAFVMVDTVKKQTVSNVVHYIYDDASTDGLAAGMQELADDPTVIYVRGEHNMGQSHARNCLIKQAVKDDCDYIAFLDSDDWWEPNHLEDSIAHLLENDVVYSKPKWYDLKHNPVYFTGITLPNQFIGKQLLYGNYIWISSVVAKKECFWSNQFDTELNGIEDWDMWIQLYQHNYVFYNKQTVTANYLVKTNGQAVHGPAKMHLMQQKHQLLPNLKLHLACGHDYTEGYINVDFYAPEDARCDARFDVAVLPYPDNSVDEIKAFHIIEHFDFFEIQKVFKEWHRVLKPGGRLWLETPDFLETCRSFVEGNPGMDIEQWRILLYNHFFAHAWIPGQTHKFLFTETQLRTMLEWAGFDNMTRLPPSSNYVRPDTYQLFLNVETFK
jgi:glycosyltransferase involved in cell wall biosynthesis